MRIWLRSYNIEKISRNLHNRCDIGKRRAVCNKQTRYTIMHTEQMLIDDYKKRITYM